MRIAMIGQKGLPATWGGIEHHVEQIGARLASRGHEVVVYCRPHYGDEPPDRYKGMRLVPVWSAGTKHLDALSHSAACTVRALRDSVDVIHYHAVGPGLLAPLPRYLSRAKVVVTVHGLDADRGKWGGPAKALLRTAERMSARVPNGTVVVSRALRRHYMEVYGCDATFIPNGVEAPTSEPETATQPPPFGLISGKYVLFVGRFVPEKNPDLLLRAFASVSADVRLVLAGGSSFTDGFSSDLRKAANRDPRVLLPGYVHGPELAALYAGAAVFVLPSAVEGLPLTLLEAISHGIPVITSDIPPHVEVLKHAGPGRRLVPVGDEALLTACLQDVLKGLESEVAGALALRSDVLPRYQWDVVTDALEEVYYKVVDRSTPALAK